MQRVHRYGQRSVTNKSQTGPKRHDCLFFCLLCYNLTTNGRGARKSYGAARSRSPSFWHKRRSSAGFAATASAAAACATIEEGDESFAGTAPVEEEAEVLAPAPAGVVALVSGLGHRESSWRKRERTLKPRRRRGSIESSVSVLEEDRPQLAVWDAKEREHTCASG